MGGVAEWGCTDLCRTKSSPVTVGWGVNDLQSARTPSALGLYR